MVVVIVVSAVRNELVAGTGVNYIECSNAEGGSVGKVYLRLDLSYRLPYKATHFYSSCRQNFTKLG